MSATAAATLSPRERRYQRTRAAIIDAALDIIGSEGMAALSIRRIAQEIDYSPAALYEYFKGKDELIDALCRQVDARLAQYLNRVSGSLTAAQRLVEIGMNYLDFARENRCEYALLFKGPPPPTGQPSNDASGFLILLDAVAALLASVTPATGKGPKTLLDTEAFAYSCWAFVHGLASLSEQMTSMTDRNLKAVHRAALERFVGAPWEQR